MQQPIIQPPLITYNLQERGRQHRGKARNFNIKALCDSINGPATQERVKTRAMLGYFGHKPRILFGLEPVESGVVAGKYNEIEPAIVTTYLEAFPDGTVKHQTEFLDSVSGKKAARMFANRIGGFSSAIDEAKSEMYGFDYVLDPNFSTNRGFALDSAGLTLDQVMAYVKSEEDEFLDKLIEAKDLQIAQMARALDSATTENEEILSILASKGAGNAVLDSVATLPISVSLDSVNRMRRDTELFRKTATLPAFIQPLSSDQDQAQDQYNTLISRIRGR